MRWGLLAALVASSCVQSSSVICGDRICPENTACAELVGVTDGDPHRCVDRDATTACDGIAPLDACTYDGLATGACYMTTDGAVCLESGCGNALVDKTEVCDDGNADAGDGCSQSCRSDETCGNGVVDPSRLDNGQLVPNERCDDGNFIGHDACNACDFEIPAWANIKGDVPIGRVNVPFTFDSMRHRFVIFGGHIRSGIVLSTPLGDTWESDGTTWVQLHPLVAPSTRRFSAMAYDAATRRTILFGGEDGAARNDTWEWDGTTWTPVTPPTSPPARKGHALAYDSKRKVVVLFGGLDAIGEYASDTWEWNGTTWREVTTATSPAPRTNASMAFDPVRGVMVMAGQYYDETAMTTIYDTWEYDGATWVQKATTGTPSILSSESLAYDAVGQRVITYANAPSTPLHTFAWNGSAWTDLQQLQAGSSIGFESLASDPVTGRVVAFGGIKGGGMFTTSSDETWMWNGATWTMQVALFPEPRTRAAAILDTRRRSIVLVGGVQPNIGTPTLYDDTWQLDGLTWTKQANQPWPEARNGAAGAYDSNRDEIVVFGGIDFNDTRHGDTWIRKNGTWTQSSTGPAPSGRTGAMMVYDPDRRQTILFGGEAAAGNSAETWAWNGAMWTQLAPAHSPSSRSGAAFAWDPLRHELVLFGGRANSGFVGDTWTWNGSDWTEHSISAPPAPRQYMTLAWNAPRGRLVLVGGRSIGGGFADAWEWDGTTWTVVMAANPPAGRSGPAVVSDPDGAGIVMLGGDNVTGDADGTAFWDHARLRWDTSETYEECRVRVDLDGDAKLGCEDPDCWARCTPLCPPGTTCDPAAPTCGDGVCDPVLEDCRICPGDCTCTRVCGDTYCDSGETQVSCPGDCTP